MVTIVSPFAAAVGQLVVNLGSRSDIHVTVSVEDSVIHKNNLSLKVVQFRNGKSYMLREMISELTLTEIQDIAVLADAIYDKLKRMA